VRKLTEERVSFASVSKWRHSWGTWLIPVGQCW
jgi:hypothetical protein